MIFGGYFSDIPEPHRFKYPDSDEKRVVRVTINSWVGISPGAIHYYATIQEEENPVWNATINEDTGEAEGWTVCWDHPNEHNGRRFTKNDFLDRVLAKAWAAKIVKKFFPDHEVRIDYDEDEKMIFRYLREGD